MNPLSSCCIAALALSCVGSAKAAYVLDQVYDPSALTTYDLGGPFGTASYHTDWAQTFTVGVTGMLGLVSFYIERNASSTPDDLVVDVRGTTGGLPGSNAAVLVSTHVAPASVSTTQFSFVTFDFSATPVPVVAGQVLAIVLGVPGSIGGYSWLGTHSTPSPYAAGGAYARTVVGASAGNWGNTSFETTDFGFKTYVSASPVPEPGGWALLAGGLALALVRVRARERCNGRLRPSS